MYRVSFDKKLQPCCCHNKVAKTNSNHGGVEDIEARKHMKGMKDIQDLENMKKLRIHRIRRTRKAQKQLRTKEGTKDKKGVGDIYDRENLGAWWIWRAPNSVNFACRSHCPYLLLFTILVPTLSLCTHLIV